MIGERWLKQAWEKKEVIEIQGRKSDYCPSKEQWTKATVGQEEGVEIGHHRK